jgi:hypothetical protein
MPNADHVVSDKVIELTKRSPYLALQRIRQSSPAERFSLGQEAWLPLLTAIREAHPVIRRLGAEILAFVPSFVNDDAGFAFLRQHQTPAVLACMCIEILDERWPDLWRELESDHPDWAKRVAREASEYPGGRAEEVAKRIAESRTEDAEDG